LSARLCRINDKISFKAKFGEGFIRLRIKEELDEVIQAKEKRQRMNARLLE
jgi:hypothetical protein